MALLVDHLRRSSPQRGAGPGGRALRAPRPARVLAVLAWAVLVVVLVTCWPRPLGGATTVVRVAGESMVPTYETGDLLVARTDAGGYAVGDVIVFDVPGGGPGAGMRVVHRVVGAVPGEWGTTYTTRGDARADDDQWQVHDQDVLGRIVLHVPRSGEVLARVLDPRVGAALVGVVVTVLLWPGRRSASADAACSERCPDDCPGPDGPSGGGPAAPDADAFPAAAAPEDAPDGGPAPGGAR